MDEDASAFRARQSSHALELRSVRSIVRVLGCTRSQALNLVRIQEAQRTLPQNANAGNRGAQLFTPAPRAEIKRGEVTTEIVRAAAGGAVAEFPPVQGAPGADAVLPTPTNCLVVAAGVLSTADVYLDAGSLTPV